jgi:hypothetical protein
MSLLLPVQWVSVRASVVFLARLVAACASDTRAGREGVRKGVRGLGCL